MEITKPVFKIFHSDSLPTLISQKVALAETCTSWSEKEWINLHIKFIVAEHVKEEHK